MSYCAKLTGKDKYSSGDEIANVKFFTTISHTYFRIIIIIIIIIIYTFV